MNRFLKILVFILIFIAIGLFAYSYYSGGIFKKPLSPKDNVEYKLNDLKLEVFYNRPSKRGREIFGGLVPYDKVWRTGANEATTFETNLPLLVDGYPLPKGKYTLWTIPRDSVWSVMFNSKQYKWGVDEHMNPMREAAFDVVKIEVPTENLNTTVEQFTIGFDNTTGELKLTMAWDKTKIAVPLSIDYSAIEKD